ncbi:MAG: nucleoside hydrolase [Erythrobacter sp.]|nr:MAG: nucleoside hydrolase [Erythrobacter sp.]
MHFNRRMILRDAALGGLLLACRQALLANQRIPQRPSARVIVDNDFAGDPDGLVGLAHQLLSPKTVVPLITVSGLDRNLGGETGSTVVPGAEAAAETVQRLSLDHTPPIASGHELGVRGQEPSDAARAIVAEAMREDALPLYFSCGGPLTNLAEALALEPAITARMTLIWIGGGGYPDGGWEYNLSADADAARHVIESSAMPVWQIPLPAYRLMQVSVAEMEADMMPISDFTRWLYARFTNPPAFFDLGGSWPMGDSPAILLTAISAESSRYSDLPARRINPDLSYGEEIPGRTVRVFDDLDLRLTWADFLAKLRLHAARTG